VPASQIGVLEPAEKPSVPGVAVASTVTETALENAVAQTPLVTTALNCKGTTFAVKAAVLNCVELSVVIVYAAQFTPPFVEICQPEMVPAVTVKFRSIVLEAQTGDGVLLSILRLPILIAGSTAIDTIFDATGAHTPLPTITRYCIGMFGLAVNERFVPAAANVVQPLPVLNSQDCMVPVVGVVVDKIVEVPAQIGVAVALKVPGIGKASTVTGVAAEGADRQVPLCIIALNRVV
jgi:hypothetical protein